MAPKITKLESIYDKKTPQGVSTPKEFDFSKINIGDYMLERGENETPLRKWLRDKEKHNAFYEEKLEIGRENLGVMQNALVLVEREMKDAKSPEEFAMLQGKKRELKGDIWTQICINIHTAFSLA